MWFEQIDQQLRAELRKINAEGMQQAATILSRLLRQPVVAAQSRQLVEGQLPSAMDQSELGLGIYLGVSGELNGGMLIFFSQLSAEWLSCQLLGQVEIEDLLSEPAESTLKEVGNIIASAFLASLDNQLKLRALPTPPQLYLAPLIELLAQQQQRQLSPCPIVCTPLSSEGNTAEHLQGAIYLFPETESLERLLDRVSAEKV